MSNSGRAGASGEGVALAQWHTDSVEETMTLAEVLGAVLRDGDVVTLTGDLGAGKTHFAQGAGRGLGIAGALVSPTFNLVLEYHDGRIPLYHFDLYRLEDAIELEDIDFYELTDAATPGAALIEWSDRFPEELPDDRLEVRIQRATSADGGSECRRDITVVAQGPQSQRLLDDWLAR